MDDLEDSLKRLFQDPRLDMRVAPDASEKVVAGARRVRRKRIALISSAGVLSLAVLAGGTFLVTRPAGPETTGVATQPSDLPIMTSEPAPSEQTAPPPPSARPEQSPSTTVRPEEPTSSRPAVASPPTADLAIGPTGFSSLRLGMTKNEVLATVSVQPVRANPAGSPCTQYQVKNLPGESTLVVSNRHGLVAVTSTAARTPEGIGVGSTEDQVRTTYRTQPSGGIATVAVPGNTAANFEFRITNGKVSAITLIAKQHDC